MIKAQRVNLGLLQQDVAAKLDMDAPMLSKIEKGLRPLKRKQIPKVAYILNVDKERLLAFWLADQVFAVLKNEKLANEAIKITGKVIKSRDTKDRND